ncbi:MAG: autotransporter domain-containing protein [Elusimicrobia bacterium]|nr:autotransporter domain-containing protein [Elusimicrobiota bacterium]
MAMKNLFSFVGALVLGVLLFPRAGFGASINSPDKTWDGEAGDTLWSNPSNWDLNSVVLNGDTIHFSTGMGTSHNDLSSINLSKIEFNSSAGAFYLDGNSVTFTGSDIDFKTIETNSASTQTVAFSGMVGLANVKANHGTLILNSTVTSPGAIFTVSGGGHVVFNQPLLGLASLSVSGNTAAQFSSVLSTTVQVGFATVYIGSTTQVPGVNIAVGGQLKLFSDTAVGGRVGLEGEFPLSTAPIINTNGFNLETTGGIKDGAGEVDPLPGRLIKTGEGVLTVKGDNTADGWSGGTTISGGTVRAGSATAFRSDTDFTLANKAGVELDLAGHSFTLSERNGGGDAGGTVILSAGILTIAGDTSSRFNGKIIGQGQLIKTGTGIFTLNGANTYSGGTSVSDGVLKGDGRGLQGNILNNGSVVFDQTGAGTYAGEMSGTGTFEKTGNGTLTITNANTFTGGTVLTAGTLAVGAGGKLGNGNVNVTGGILKGDGSPRSIEVAGDYIQSGGRLELTLYGVGPALQDRLITTNTATLGGTLSVLVHRDYLPVGTSTRSIVEAGSLNGAFDFNSTGASLRFELATSATNVVLTSIKTPYGSFAVTSNEQSVATYVDSLYSSATGDLALVMGELNALPAQNLSDALKSISPQSYQTLTTMGMSNLSGFSQRIHTQLALSRAGKRGVQTAGFEQSRGQTRWGSWTAEAGVRDDSVDDPFFVPEQKWGAFITGDGFYASLPGDADVESGNVMSGGMTAGVDFNFSPRWTVGLGLGFARTNGEIGSEALKIDGKSLTPAVYGSFNGNRYYVDSLLAFQNSDYDSQRKVVVGAQTFVADGNPRSRAYAWGVEAGLPLRKGFWDFVPIGGLQMAQETVTPFEETGAGAVSLSLGEQKRQSLASKLGVRLQRQLSQDGRDRVELRTAWRHDFKGETSIDASFVGAGGSFSVTGSDPQKDSVLLGGELSAGFSETLSLVFSYDGDFGDASAHWVHGGARFRF